MSSESQPQDQSQPKPPKPPKSPLIEIVAIAMAALLTSQTISTVKPNLINFGASPSNGIMLRIQGK